MYIEGEIRFSACFFCRGRFVCVLSITARLKHFHLAEHYIHNTLRLDGVLCNNSVYRNSLCVFNRMIFHIISIYGEII